MFEELLKACKKNEIEKVRILLNNGVDPTEYDNMALEICSIYGHAELVKLLLQDPRVDPSQNENYSIQLASEYGQTEVVKILLKDPRVNISDCYYHAIRWASRNDHVDTLKELLKDPRLDLSSVMIKKIIASCNNKKIKKMLNDLLINDIKDIYKL